VHVVKYSPSWAVTLSSLAAWVALLAARGGFWRARLDAHLPAEGESLQAGSAPARVEAIVPARDEAETVGPSLASLVAQRYPGELHVTLVDDHSSDATRMIARAATHALVGRDRLDVVAARPLLPGWSGKLNALASGVEAVLAERGAPDYWLFADADIVHDPENVAALVAKARRDDAALVSLMVRLRCRSAWEMLLVPAFVFFFAKLYPFQWSNDPHRPTAAAAGGCVLLSHDAFERIGRFPAIADALIDDCALALAVKRSGGRTWLGLTDRTESVRRYDRLEQFWTMVKRTAFTQLGRSYPLLAFTVAGMTLLYVVPPAATIAGLAMRRRVGIAGALAWGAMIVAYLPTLRAYRRPVGTALTLPVAALLYVAMTVDSALAHARGFGGAWKGRVFESAPDDAGERASERAQSAGRVEGEASA
jgi:hopene-associated glycosyltransferase HpnB